MEISAKTERDPPPVDSDKSQSEVRSLKEKLSNVRKPTALNYICINCEYNMYKLDESETRRRARPKQILETAVKIVPQSTRDGNRRGLAATGQGAWEPIIKLSVISF
jgi:hypothetical protein